MKATPRTPGWFLLTRHWLSLFGAALVATAVISLLFVAPQEIRGRADNPYIGIILFLVLPHRLLRGLAADSHRGLLEQTRCCTRAGRATFDRKAALRRLGLFLGFTTALQCSPRNATYLPGCEAHGDPAILRLDLSLHETRIYGLSECAAFQGRVRRMSRRAWCGGVGQQQDEWNSATGQDRPQDSNDADTFCFGKQPPRALSRDLRELPLAAEVRWWASAGLQQIRRG